MMNVDTLKDIDAASIICAWHGWFSVDASVEIDTSPQVADRVGIGELGCTLNISGSGLTLQTTLTLSPSHSHLTSSCPGVVSPQDLLLVVSLTPSLSASVR